MRQSMNVYISNEFCIDKRWSKNTIISIDNKGINIYLNDISKKNNLEKLQIAAKKIQLQQIKKVNLIGHQWSLENIWFFWQGYRNAKNEFKINKISNIKEEEKKDFFNCKKVIDWVCNIINLPANKISPLELALQSINFLKDISKEKIKYSIVQGKDLLKNSYSGIYQVGSGSKQKPVFLNLEYNPNMNSSSSNTYACLVGKGITFDTGGYSIKNSFSMNSMKSDMAGAATLVGALALSIIKGLDKKIKLYLCCAENMISGSALKLGDIISYRNGKTVEVNNTDAEGRLILADGLIDASQQNAKIIIDAATLTGAAKIALGNDYQAVFSFDDFLLKNFMKSAEEENELFWQLPLSEFHRKQMHSDFADLSNISHLKNIPGATNAAAFLSHFVKNYHKGWMHIDCSSSYQENDTNKFSTGATGLGVKTIANFLLKNLN